MPPFASCIMSNATYLWHHSVQSERQWMNRAGVSLVRDRGPAASAQDEMGWPPFLMRKDLSYTPTAAKWLPRENFCWCSRPLPPPPPPSVHPFISIPPTQTQPAPSPPPWHYLGVQRSFCFGGEVTRPRLQSRVHSTSSHGHQHSGQMKRSSSLGRQPTESKRREIFHKIHSYKVFCCAGAVLQKLPIIQILS